MADGYKTGGRKPGTPNKATSAAREAIGRFVDANADKLGDWLDEVYAKDGAKVAIQCFASFVEFHVPKLARNELSGTDGGPIRIVAGPLDEDL